jgi:hypothetical protein
MKFSFSRISWWISTFLLASRFYMQKLAKAGLLIKIKQALWAQWHPPRRSLALTHHCSPQTQPININLFHPLPNIHRRCPVPLFWAASLLATCICSGTIYACAKLQISISTPPTIILSRPLVVLQTPACNRSLANKDKERRWCLNGQNWTIKRWDIVFLC